MSRALALAVVFVAACGSETAAPAPSPTPAASASPAAARYAIVDSPAAEGRPAQIQILSESGQVVATALHRPRTTITSGGNGDGAVAPELPYESAAATLVYYLDGDSALRSLAPDGKTADVGSLPGSAHVHVAFSVRPDGGRIAVSVMDYSLATPKLTLYASDLNGANRVDLLSSTGIYVWPVGWHGSNLVAAVGPAFVQQGAENPYTAFAGYHVVDPASGRRLADVCSNGAPIGPLTPVGTLCSSAGGLSVAAYDGSSRPFAGAAGPSCLALATTGTTVACGTNPINLVGLDGSTKKTTASGFAQGWIDDQRFVYASMPGGPSAPTLSVYDVRSGAAQPTTASGTFVATLPGAL
jgi:hypothetical protein